MPSKKSSTPAASAPVSAPAPTPAPVVAAPAPVVEQKTGKTKKSKTVAPVEVPAPAPVEVPAPIPAPEPVAVPAIESSELAVGASDAATTAAENFASKSADFKAKLKQLSETLSFVKKEYEALEKATAKEIKLAKKGQRKRREPKDPNAKPKNNGFQIPVKISDELTEFLRLEKGTMISRTDVTKIIRDYVDAHNLKKPEDKRLIIVDDSLKALLRVDESVKLSFFGLQKYLARHFEIKPKVIKEKKPRAKKGDVAAAAEAPVASA